MISPEERERLQPLTTAALARVHDRQEMREKYPRLFEAEFPVEWRGAGFKLPPAPASDNEDALAAINAQLRAKEPDVDLDALALDERAEILAYFRARARISGALFVEGLTAAKPEPYYDPPMLNDTIEEIDP